MACYNSLYSFIRSKEITAKNNLFEEIKIGRQQNITALNVWSLHIKTPNTPLQGFLRPPLQDFVRFTELPEPRINGFIAENLGDVPMMFIEGTQIEGLRQDRIIPQGFILEPRASHRSDAVCGQRGKWSPEPSPSRIASRAPISVINAMRTQGDSFTLQGLKTRQKSVWDSVSRQETRTGTRETNSLIQVMREDSSSAQLSSLFEELSTTKTEQDQQGVLIATGGEILAMEIFGTPELLAANFSEMMQATAFDIEYSTSNSVSDSEIKAFIDSALNLRLHLVGGNENYKNLSREANGLSLRALQYQGTTAHILAINTNHKVLQPGRR